ncbi:MAG TPA: hypothetical protein VGH38_24735 [Bryobacteraceae bacterium]|jgi:hypothetical protein
MTADQLPAETVPVTPAGRLLTAAEFHQVADVPPEVEWFATISNRHTRRAHENAVKDFMRFTGIERPEEFRTVTCAHILHPYLPSRTASKAMRRRTSRPGSKSIDSQDSLQPGFKDRITVTA